MLRTWFAPEVFRVDEEPVGRPQIRIDAVVKPFGRLLPGGDFPQPNSHLVPYGERAAVRGSEQRPRLLHSAAWFLSHISAFATAADNNLLSVTFSAPSADVAMAGLNATVSAYSDVTRMSVTNLAKAVLARLDSPALADALAGKGQYRCHRGRAV